MVSINIKEHTTYNTWLQLLMSADSVWKINTLANIIFKWSILHIGERTRYNTWLQVLMSADSVWKINTLANTISKWSLLT